MRPDYLFWKHVVFILTNVKVAHVKGRFSKPVFVFVKGGKKMCGNTNNILVCCTCL